MGNINSTTVTDNWFDEKVDKIDSGNWVYKLICALLFRTKKKLSYKEIYMILFNLNKKKLGEETAKRKAINRVIEIYKSQHEGKTPI